HWAQFFWAMKFILPSSAVADRALMGGKAAALAALDDFPVPAWFVVSPAGFCASAGTELAAQISEARSGAECDAALQRVSLAPSLAGELDASLRSLAQPGVTFAV